MPEDDAPFAFSTCVQTQDSEGIDVDRLIAENQFVILTRQPVDDDMSIANVQLIGVS
jgi:hypothetical protein